MIEKTIDLNKDDNEKLGSGINDEK